MPRLVASTCHPLDDTERLVGGLVSKVGVENFHDPRAGVVGGHVADEGKAEGAAGGFIDSCLDQRLEVVSLSMEQDHDRLARLPASLLERGKLVQSLDNG